MIVNKKKNLVWVGLVVLVNVTNKLIIADSPLEDISGCRRPKGSLDILAGFNFHLSLYTKFHLDYSNLKKTTFFYICFTLELED